MSSHWLDRYASGYYRWKTSTSSLGRAIFTRPLGLVENFFSYDGIDYGGRADMTFGLTLELSHSESTHEPDIFTRVALAWTSLRLQHALLMAKVAEDSENRQRCFVVEEPGSVEEAIQEAKSHITQLEARKDRIDVDEFRVHSSNTGRIVDANKCLSKLVLLPLEHMECNKKTVNLFIITSHEISDGMATYNWVSHFLRILNMSERAIYDSIEQHRVREAVQSRLPVAQEDLYLRVPGNRARQLWFWAIIRILRHVRKPLLAGFENPLRKERRSDPKLSPKYTDVLDYTETRRPPLTSNYTAVTLSPAATRNMAKLTRSVGSTVGAASFAFVALVMMELEEERHPDIPLSGRKPMIMGFPMNPKPYYNFTGLSDSCMLAFGENFALPFLPSHLDRAGRFKLLLRQCQSKLNRYQKRTRNPSVGLLAAYSPLRLLANGYVAQLDRGWSMLRPNGQRRGPHDVQGSVYPASRDVTLATNGVSSVGNVRHFFNDKARFVPDSERARDLEVRFVATSSGVRARDGEFLIASKMIDESMIFSVSYDASIMDDKLVKKWEEKMQRGLEPSALASL